MEGLLGKKLGMSQIFDQEGNVIPVTVIEAGPCYVTQIKAEEKDHYTAIQLAFGQSKAKALTKPVLGHLKKARVKPAVWLQELRVATVEGYELGQAITVDVFQVGELVNVSGWTKGRGFAGTVKRHGFGGGPKSHGQSDRHRAPGSIGQSASPSRVFKGMRMAGHMGNRRVTVRNLKVIQVDQARNLLVVKGAVPGAVNGLVSIEKVKSETP